MNIKRIVFALGLFLAVTLPAMAQTGAQDILAGPTTFANTGTLVVQTGGRASVTVNASGSGSGLTWVFQGTTDAVNWTTLQGYVPSTCASAVTFSANGNWVIPSAGYQAVRVNLTAITGTETFTMNASVAPGSCTGGSGSGGGLSNVNLTQLNSVALGSPSAYGTSPGAVNVPGVNAFVTNPISSGPAQRTIVPLDVSTVTTGGAAVTALTAGHRTAGGFLYNPIGATINLCINEQGTASGTTSAGALTCIQPGQSYTLTPAAGAVSVITSDSSHPFSGQGLN